MKRFWAAMLTMLLWATGAMLAAQGDYCEVSGNKDYNIMGVVTSGAAENIVYSDTADGKQNYYHYTANKVKLGSAKEFIITIVQKNNWSKTNVWVDWNGDRQFAEDELAIHFGAADQLNEGPLRGTVKVPPDVAEFFRMRIQTVDAWIEYVSPCGEVWYSFTKDFDIQK